MLSLGVVCFFLSFFPLSYPPSLLAALRSYGNGTPNRSPTHIAAVGVECHGHGPGLAIQFLPSAAPRQFGRREGWSRRHQAAENRKEIASCAACGTTICTDMRLQETTVGLGPSIFFPLGAPLWSNVIGAGPRHSAGFHSSGSLSEHPRKYAQVSPSTGAVL